MAPKPSVPARLYYVECVARHLIHPSLKELKVKKKIDLIHFLGDRPCYPAVELICFTTIISLSQSTSDYLSDCFMKKAFNLKMSDPQMMKKRRQIEAVNPAAKRMCGENKSTGQAKGPQRSIFSFLGQ